MIGQGIALIILPVVMLPFLFAALWHDPIGSVVEFPFLYFIFVFLPVAAGTALIVAGLRRNRKNKQSVDR